MRECRGLVDSLMSYIQSCVAEENPDDKVNCLVSINTTFIQHYGQKSRQQKTSSYKYTLPWMYCRVHLMCVGNAAGEGPQACIYLAASVCSCSFVQVMGVDTRAGMVQAGLC